MPQSIRITDDDYEVIKLIKDKTGWTYKDIFSKAIDFYAKTKKILPWDVLPKSPQEKLKDRAKKIIDKQTF